MKRPEPPRVAGSRVSALRHDLIATRLELARSRAEVDVLRRTVGRYLAVDLDDLVREAAGCGGERREVTVMFADLRGFATLSELIPPEEMTGLLSEIFGATSEVILAEGGTIIDFEGDAVVAAFNARGDQPRHACRAMHAALRLLAVVERLNAAWDARGTSQTWRAAGITSLAMRVGLHSGAVVAGSVGTASRAKFALVGDVVNTASRIEELNGSLDTTLLVSEVTARQLDERQFAMLVDLGCHAVKGKSCPVHVMTMVPGQRR